MWAHDVAGRSPSGGLPIGRTARLSKASGGRIVADFEFLADDPFAQRVKNAWDKGFIQAASIRWLPLEGKPTEGGRWRDTRSELLEWSIVAVPADPEALREAQSRMIGSYLAAEGAGSEEHSREGRDDSAGKNGTSDDDLSEIRASVGAMRVALAADRTESGVGAGANRARRS